MNCRYSELSTLLKNYTILYFNLGIYMRFLFSKKKEQRVKGTVFYFFPGKVYTPLTHSIWENFVFLFFHFLERKKKNCFIFFPRKSLKATHSAERQLPLIKRYFCTFVAYFFFPTKMCIFFFPGIVYYLLTHSFSKGGKKIQPRKKNTAIYSLTRFFPKNVKK